MKVAKIKFFIRQKIKNVFNKCHLEHLTASLPQVQFFCNEVIQALRKIFHSNFLKIILNATLLRTVK